MSLNLLYIFILYYIYCYLWLFRYGLPVNFQAMLVHPHKKSVKRLRDLLNQLYAPLDSGAQQQGQGGGGNDVSSIFPPKLKFQSFSESICWFNHSLGRINRFSLSTPILSTCSALQLALAFIINWQIMPYLHLYTTNWDF